MRSPRRNARPQPLAVILVASLVAVAVLVLVGKWMAHDDAVAQEPQAPVATDTGRSAKSAAVKFGVAVNTDLLAGDDRYRSIVDSQFSSVTPENVMKWGLVEPQQGTLSFTAADQLVAFAQAHGQVVRGHTLVWHNQLPSWLTSETFTPEQVRDLLHAHVTAEVTHFKGKIQQWDVVNEALDDDGTFRKDVFFDAYQQLTGNGSDYIADAFRWAHDADPDALLFYNDYNLEFTGAKSNAAYALVQQLKAQGVPIDGVGFQGHLDVQYGFPDLQANLQRFADLGLRVAMTEVDVRAAVTKNADGTQTPSASDARKQAQYWSDTVKACLAVTACTSFTTWGVSDDHSWIPGTFPGQGAGLLYDDRSQPKPELDVVRSLLLGTAS